MELERCQLAINSLNSGRHYVPWFNDSFSKEELAVLNKAFETSIIAGVSI